MNKKKFKQPQINVERLKRALLACYQSLARRKTVTGPQAFSIFIRAMNENY